MQLQEPETKTCECGHSIREHELSQSSPWPCKECDCGALCIHGHPWWEDQ